MSKSITDAQWHYRLDVLRPQTIITPLTVAFYFFHLLLCSTPVTCWQWVSLQCGRLPAWLPGLELGSIMRCFVCLCVFSLHLYIACKSSLNCCKWSSFKPDAFLLDTEVWKWRFSCRCFHNHACKKPREIFIVDVLHKWLDLHPEGRQGVSPGKIWRAISIYMDNNQPFFEIFLFPAKPIAQFLDHRHFHKWFIRGLCSQ